MERRDQAFALDERANARSRRSRNCTRMVNKIGYPDKWRDYSSDPDRARRLFSATWSRATVFEVAARSWRKSASRWIAPNGK